MERIPSSASRFPRMSSSEMTSMSPRTVSTPPGPAAQRLPIARLISSSVGGTDGGLWCVRVGPRLAVFRPGSDGADGPLVGRDSSELCDWSVFVRERCDWSAGVR
jgi:hypothetical protein